MYTYTCIYMRTRMTILTSGHTASSGLPVLEEKPEQKYPASHLICRENRQVHALHVTYYVHTCTHMCVCDCAKSLWERATIMRCTWMHV